MAPERLHMQHIVSIIACTDFFVPFCSYSVPKLIEDLQFVGLATLAQRLSHRSICSCQLACDWNWMLLCVITSAFFLHALINSRMFIITVSSKNTLKRKVLTSYYRQYPSLLSENQLNLVNQMSRIYVVNSSQESTTAPQSSPRCRRLLVALLLQDEFDKPRIFGPNAVQQSVSR